jgi:glycosyltransferase involved in cell wall biosynthesis
MLERIPSSPPEIAPIPADEKDRPLFSVMIPVYNCSQYLLKCIRSVLLQDPGPQKMQIEVVDDCSTDADIGALVQEIGKGRVGYFRKEQNMGSIRNFETCINRARGHLVHILHGDDHVKDGFYKEIERLYKAFPGIGAAFTDYYYIDAGGKPMYADEKLLKKPGILEDWLYYIAAKQRIQPPAMVVRRTTYEQLGGFYAVKYGEDWEMWARIASRFDVAHSPKQLACYRVHNNNITGSSLATGQNIKDIHKVMSIIQNYLPHDKKKEVLVKAKKNFAEYSAWMAHALYHYYREDRGAIKQVNGALGMYTNATTLKLAIKLYVKLLIRYRR